MQEAGTGRVAGTGADAKGRAACRYRLLVWLRALVVGIFPFSPQVAPICFCFGRSITPVTHNALVYLYFFLVVY